MSVEMSVNIEVEMPVDMAIEMPVEMLKNNWTMQQFEVDVDLKNSICLQGWLFTI